MNKREVNLKQAMHKANLAEGADQSYVNWRIF